MNANVLKRAAALAALSLLAGCATTVETKSDNAILSAEQVQAMIRVEMKVLEPLPIDQAVADLR